MKRILWSVVLVVSVAVGQYSPYSSDWVEGTKRYCKYLDGTIITVPYYRNCPMSVE